MSLESRCTCNVALWFCREHGWDCPDQVCEVHPDESHYKAWELFSGEAEGS